jgi:predicted DsbA family dithiol-disulfide isomerase
MTAHVAQQAAGEGLDYDFDRLVVANSLRAHRLLHVAAPLGAGDAVKEGLLRAHFVEGRDIGDDDELVRIGAAAGVPEEAVRSGLDDPEVAASVERDFALARSLGISGVPFFVLDQKYAVSGAQPPEVFQQALEQAWAAAHPLTVLGGDAEACGPDGCAV